MPSSRAEWEERISELVVEAQQHKRTYVEPIGMFMVYIHPNVFSPKYQPESLWYAANISSIVPRGSSFLEIGVGSGLVSMYAAASGAIVKGVDVNPDAVQTTQKNFQENNLKGTFDVSDVFDNVLGTFDFIFWNHPWQFDSAVREELKSEKTLDEDYKLLTRFIAEAGNYLTTSGSILLGTSCYADSKRIEDIFSQNGYSHKSVEKGERPSGKGVTEEYYIIQLRHARLF
jgi:methylase of polypeptide subunit release factors